MSSTHDPGAVRVGNTERDEAIGMLGVHFAEGRLRTDEYEQRVDTALAATVRNDLQALFDDLPAPRPAFLLPSELPLLAPFPMLPVSPPDRYTAQATSSDKSKIVAGVLQVCLPFGIGRFYTGHSGLALTQLAVTIFTLGLGALWSFIDGLILLVNGGTDAEGRPLRD